MERGVLTTTLIALIAALSCCFGADRNVLDDAIDAFPDSARFRPDEAVRSVNALISAGRDAACQALLDAADYQWLAPTDPVNEKVLLLCRLLFSATNSATPLRPPLDGLVMPVERTEDTKEPVAFPFVITNGVPFLLPRITHRGLIATRAPEGGWKYVALCKDFGTFRTEPFPAVTWASASNALNQVLASAEWRALKWGVAASNYSWYSPTGQAQLVNADWAENYMRQQIENMKRPIFPQHTKRYRPDPY
jgi:hypothetical protein